MSASLTARIAAAWTGAGVSWRAEKARGLEEGRLLALGFGASLFLTIARIGSEIAAPRVAIGDERTAWIAATVFIGFSFGVLALYAVAAVSRLIAKLFGGAGGWAETRLALFWSGLAAGPAAAFIHILLAVAGAPGAGGTVAGVIWAGLFAPMLAAAHGFQAQRVYASFAIIAIGFMAIVMVGS